MIGGVDKLSWQSATERAIRFTPFHTPAGQAMPRTVRP